LEEQRRVSKVSSFHLAEKFSEYCSIIMIVTNSFSRNEELLIWDKAKLPRKASTHIYRGTCQDASINVMNQMASKR